jgi:hypothetical protein
VQYYREALSAIRRAGFSMYIFCILLFPSFPAVAKNATTEKMGRNCNMQKMHIASTKILANEYVQILHIHARLYLMLGGLALSRSMLCKTVTKYQIFRKQFLLRWDTAWRPVKARGFLLFFWLF